MKNAVAWPDRIADMMKARAGSREPSVGAPNRATERLGRIRRDYLILLRALRLSAQYRFIRSETALRAASDMCCVRADACFRV